MDLHRLMDEMKLSNRVHMTFQHSPIRVSIKSSPSKCQMMMMIYTVDRLRRRDPKLKVLLAVRKEGHLSLLTNEYTRRSFVNSLVGHLRRYRFDGVVLHFNATQITRSTFIDLMQVLINQ